MDFLCPSCIHHVRWVSYFLRILSALSALKLSTLSNCHYKIAYFLHFIGMKMLSDSLRVTQSVHYSVIGQHLLTWTMRLNRSTILSKIFRARVSHHFRSISAKHVKLHQPDLYKQKHFIRYINLLGSSRVLFFTFYNHLEIFIFYSYINLPTNIY